MEVDHSHVFLSYSIFLRHRFHLCTSCSCTSLQSTKLGALYLYYADHPQEGHCKLLHELLPNKIVKEPDLNFYLFSSVLVFLKSNLINRNRRSLEGLSQNVVLLLCCRIG